MAVQLPPAVPPTLPSPLQLGWCNGNKENFAFCSIGVARPVTHRGEGEPKPPAFVLCSHNNLCSQRSFFVSVEMDLGWNISATVGRKFEGPRFSVFASSLGPSSSAWLGALRVLSSNLKMQLLPSPEGREKHLLLSLLRTGFYQV